MDRVVIKQSTEKTLWLSLLTGIMLAAGISETYYKRISFATGIFCIACAGFAFVYLLYRLLNPRDMLVIDSEGFTDASTYLGVGFVPWSNVKRIYVDRIPIYGSHGILLAKKEHIFIELHDIDEVLSNLSDSQRSIINVNMSLGYGPIMINLDLSSAKRDDVLKMMKEYHESRLTPGRATL